LGLLLNQGPNTVVGLTRLTSPCAHLAPLPDLATGAANSGGQPKAGVDTGPLQLIEGGLIEDIKVSSSRAAVRGRVAANSRGADQHPVRAPPHWWILQSLGWAVDFRGKDDLEVAITSDLPDPDIGILKKPRLVSKVRSHAPAEPRGRSDTTAHGLTFIQWAQVTKDVSEMVYAHASKGELTITLGGDHSLVSRKNTVGLS